MRAVYPERRREGPRPSLSLVVPRPSCGEVLLDRCGTRLGGGRNPHQAALVQDFGDLDRVGGGALEQVVADDPHLQAARVRGVAPQAADEDLVAAGARRAPSGSRASPGRRPASGRAGRPAARAPASTLRSSRVSRSPTPSASCAPGTRAQVTAILMLSSPRILRVSNIILRSSSVWSSPSTKLPAPPSTLNAMWCG